MPKIWINLLNLFFPRLCVICSNPLIDGEEQVCLSCICDLPYTNFHLQDNNPVSDLFAGKALVVHATALFYYEKGGKVQRLIHSFKYHENKQLAFQLGRQMGITLLSGLFRTNTNILIPVPLHKKKKRKRGYNQAEYLCHGLASVWDMPVITDVLIRKAKSETQTRKSVYERWQNVENTFRIQNGSELAGKHILLVDDVVTSGSTLLACIRALGTIPDIRISVLALGVALP